MCLMIQTSMALIDPFSLTAGAVFAGVYSVSMLSAILVKRRTMKVHSLPATAGKFEVELFKHYLSSETRLLIGASSHFLAQTQRELAYRLASIGEITEDSAAYELSETLLAGNLDTDTITMLQKYMNDLPVSLVGALFPEEWQMVPAHSELAMRRLREYVKYDGFGVKIQNVFCLIFMLFGSLWHYIKRFWGECTGYTGLKKQIMKHEVVLAAIVMEIERLRWTTSQLVQQRFAGPEVKDKNQRMIEQE